MNDDALPLSQHDLLSARECAEVRDQVIALKGRWTRRSGGSFFTLGAASYMDAARDRTDYLEAAKATNPLLRDSFGWLHERVRGFFEDLLGEAVRFDPLYALPGFHVFEQKGEDRSRENVAARAHFDLQWMHLFPGWIPPRTLSFTLPIEEPSGGASMAVWPARYEEVVRFNLSAVDCASSRPQQTLTYARGRIVVHDGLVLHAIGRASVPTPVGYRITLQGHGVRSPEGWTVYW
jgi:hypothetical protein